MKEDKGKLEEFSNEPSVTDIVLNALIPGGCTNFTRGMDRIGQLKCGSYGKAFAYGTMLYFDGMKFDMAYDILSKYLI